MDYYSDVAFLLRARIFASDLLRKHQRAAWYWRVSQCALALGDEGTHWDISTKGELS